MLPDRYKSLTLGETSTALVWGALGSIIATRLADKALDGTPTIVAQIISEPLQAVSPLAGALACGAAAAHYLAK